MEKRNSIEKDQNSIPNFPKKNKMKLGGEENTKLFIPNNSEINNDSKNNVQNTKDRVKFLFPDLSNNDINKVLERSEYNIEKTIELLRELKQEQKKDLEAKNPKPKINKRIKKRNYNEFTQSIKEKEKQENNKKEIVNNNNTTNINNNITNEINEKEEINNQINQTQSNNNINENNNLEYINLLISKLDEDKKDLINRQIDFLLNKFSKMKDISELKNLLVEIGFPKEKEDIDKNKINVDEINKKLDEKLKANQEKRNSIVALYKKYTKTCEEIKQKEEKIDELNNTYVNLLGIETDQKIRKEYYENELQEDDNCFNNYLNGPKEGC